MSSFPNIIYGDYGDEKVQSSTKISNLGLGVKMILPDGREFVHAKASTAAALTRGTLNVSKAVAGTSVNVAAGAAAAIGSRTIVLTMPATTLCTVVDQYADGYASANDDTGEGFTYKIKTSSTAAASSTATFTLHPRDGIQVALVSGTSEFTIRENEYYGILTRATGTSEVGVFAGVAPIAVSAGYYCWIQKKGPATVLAAGTLAVTGRPVAAATVTAGGFTACVTTADTATWPAAIPLGECMVAAAASTEYCLVNLEIP